MRRPLVVTLFAFALAATAGAESMRLEERAGRRARLTLPAELGERWSEVNVGRLLVRSAGAQASLAPSPLPASRHLELALPGEGCSMVQADLGAPDTRGRSDSWQRVTRCTKIVRCAAGAGRDDRRRAASLVTAKTGSRIEIRPLFNPLALTPGADLPVRLYFEGEAVAGAEVVALGPQGARRSVVTDRVGIGTLRIDAGGSWIVRFRYRGAVAELLFDVQES